MARFVVHHTAVKVSTFRKQTPNTDNNAHHKRQKRINHRPKMSPSHSRKDATRNGKSKFIEHIDQPRLNSSSSFSQMDLEPGTVRHASPPQKKLTLERVSTAVQNLVRKLTPENREERAKAKATRKIEKAIEERREKERKERSISQLRRQAIENRSIDWDSLYQLAAAEHVYLNPRAHRNDRFHGDDYSLASGLVARVSGRLHNDKYIFLGRNGHLFIGRHSLGRGAEQISFQAEWEYHEYRKIARAYYQLCDSFPVAGIPTHR
ncbi:hypothetical protein RRF57_000024 [Xylaria bambusicola]|uniref:Uncharacterized protein n=1 Tax=Xylaria bambusicola TaxID=326684 RepID=A0AAN7Z247_9PEZI